VEFFVIIIVDILKSEEGYKERKSIDKEKQQVVTKWDIDKTPDSINSFVRFSSYPEKLIIIERAERVRVKKCYFLESGFTY